MADPRANPFGQRLRALRMARGLSLADLARAVHYSKGQLSKIENGAARGNLRLAHLCDVLLESDGVLAELATSSSPSRKHQRLAALGSSLPPDTRYFAGRSGELALLYSFLAAHEPTAGRSRICVVHGMPGVGKTTFVVRTAHEAAPLFPDGCMFVDLHGYTPDATAITPAEGLDRCLRQLGLPGESIPRHIDDRIALFRNQLTSRRILLVLDNAASVAQVTPLLPAAPGCAVLITSRRRLAALDDADHIHIDTLSQEDSDRLFRSVAAIAGTTDAKHVTDIVRSCSGLPLAIRVTAARYRDHPTRTLADMAHWLAGHDTSLHELDDGERAATAAFRASFERLADDQRHVFVAVASYPGQDFDAYTAAAMADMDPPAARRLLDELVDSHLVIGRMNHRYHLHDLVRQYAITVLQSMSSESNQQPSGALLRAMDHYRSVAHAADTLISPHRYHPPLSSLSVRSGTWLPTSRESAVAWMNTEQNNLIASCSAAAKVGSSSHCWQLAYALRGYLFRTKNWDAWISTHELALGVARRRADRTGQAHMLNSLGVAHLERQNVDAAQRCCDEALTLFRALADEHGICSALGNRAWIYVRRGLFAEALADQVRAAAYYERVGAAASVAVALRGIAIAEAGLSAYDDAVDHIARARHMAAELDLPLDEAMALNCLGDIELQRGEQANARAAYREAVAVSRLCASGFEEARAQVGIASTTADPDTRRRHLMSGLDLYVSLNAPEAAQVRHALERIS